MTSNTYMLYIQFYVLLIHVASRLYIRILHYEAVVNNPLSVIKVRSFEREQLNFSLTRHFLKS